MSLLRLLQAGVLVEQLSIAAHVLDSLGLALCSVSSLSVGLCEVGFPGFSRPLHIRLAKLRVVLEQRQLPKVWLVALLHELHTLCLLPEAHYVLAVAEALQQLLSASQSQTHA